MEKLNEDVLINPAPVHTNNYPPQSLQYYSPNPNLHWKRQAE